MQIIASPHHKQHSTVLQLPGCPIPCFEIPERAEAILTAITGTKVGEVIEPQDFGPGPIQTVHSPEFIEYLKTAYESSRPFFEGPKPAIADTYAGRGSKIKPTGFPGRMGYFAFDTTCPILEGTWGAAYWSAQCAITAADLVRQGKRTAYALCRPPGHHAAHDQHGGFCYLNNAAIAARALQQGTHQRVAVLDIDYHHGNGTQEIFYRDATVLYGSIHADPNLDYPFFWGGCGERGEGPGEGYNRNWPLPSEPARPLFSLRWTRRWRPSPRSNPVTWFCPPASISWRATPSLWVAAFASVAMGWSLPPVGSPASGFRP